MAYDISEIKKLPVEEKLQIIDELWETINSEAADNDETFDEEPEVVVMLQERMGKYEKGEGVFYTGEESVKMISQKLEEFRKSNNG